MRLSIFQDIGGEAVFEAGQAAGELGLHDDAHAGVRLGGGERVGDPIQRETVGDEAADADRA